MDPTQFSPPQAYLFIAYLTAASELITQNRVGLIVISIVERLFLSFLCAAKHRAAGQSRALQSRLRRGEWTERTSLHEGECLPVWCGSVLGSPVSLVLFFICNFYDAVCSDSSTVLHFVSFHFILSSIYRITCTRHIFYDATHERCTLLSYITRLGMQWINKLP